MNKETIQRLSGIINSCCKAVPQNSFIMYEKVILRATHQRSSTNINLYEQTQRKISIIITWLNFWKASQVCTYRCVFPNNQTNATNIFTVRTWIDIYGYLTIPLFFHTIAKYFQNYLIYHFHSNTASKLTFLFLSQWQITATSIPAESNTTSH